MTEKKAIIIISILAFFALAAPVFVLLKAKNLNAGWKGILWDSTEVQVQDWVKKNNNKASWSRCNLSHFGVNCYKITWKENEKSPFEYIEFQFKDNKLKAVIETEHQRDFQKNDLKIYGRAEFGRDLAKDYYKEKGIKYQLTDRVFFYEDFQNKKRIALQILVRSALNSEEIADENLYTQITSGYYSPDYYDDAKESNENFPSFRFIK